MVELSEMGTETCVRRGSAIATFQTLNSACALGGARAASHDKERALVPVVVRAVHFLVVRVVVVDLGVVQ